MSPTKVNLNEQQTSDAKLRTTYSVGPTGIFIPTGLFHEIQYRATKNALMNYYQAELYEERGSIWKNATAVLTGASASGVLASLAQKGRILASKMGVAGLVGLPVCGVIQLASSSTSELVPSYTELAKKHVAAAAGWMRVAETARIEQLKMKHDSKYDLQQIMARYEELILRKENISKEVLIPRDTHRHFHANPEVVYLAMTEKTKTYREFREFEQKRRSSDARSEDTDVDFLN